MGAGAIPILLLILFLAVAVRLVFSLNRDLYRAKAWGELGRKALPFGVLALMVITLPLVQGAGDSLVPLIWAIVLGALILGANFISMPAAERRAGKAFRKGDYAGAADRFRALAEEKPLGRYYAFLGAALGANEDHEESINASTKAVELDPEYGIAYYNRALVQRKLGRKSRSNKDLKRALGSDLPRRYRTAVRRLLEDE